MRDPGEARPGDKPEAASRSNRGDVAGLLLSVPHDADHGTHDTPNWHGVHRTEVLNELKLGRIRSAIAAYARTAALAS